MSKSFAYRILIVEDDADLRAICSHLLRLQGYEVIGAADGFDALLTLKRSMPDIIISDLRMPNMNGLEFLSVVRRRFPAIPVIAVSGEFSGLSVPESVLADAFFAKGEYKREELFAKIEVFLQDLPLRPRVGRSDKAAVWVKSDKGTLAVTCTQCLRAFPVLAALGGVNQVDCDFCATTIRFEIIGTHGTDDPVLR